MEEKTVIERRFRLNELVETPRGLARVVGVFRDKDRGLDRAIVQLEGGSRDPLNGGGQLVYADWADIKRPGPGSEPQPRLERQAE